jgi:excisionase family DNA binding protein
VNAATSEERYLTTADALEYLNTTPRTLYRLLADGAIPAVRVGHQWRFRKNDLDEWLKRQTARAPASKKSAPTSTAGPVPRGSGERDR